MTDAVFQGVVFFAELADVGVVEVLATTDQGNPGVAFTVRQEVTGGAEGAGVGGGVILETVIQSLGGASGPRNVVARTALRTTGHVGGQLFAVVDGGKGGALAEGVELELVVTNSTLVDSGLVDPTIVHALEFTRVGGLQVVIGLALGTQITVVDIPHAVVDGAGYLAGVVVVTHF